MFDEPEILVPSEMSNIRRVAGDQIVDSKNAMPFGQQAVGQMRSQKASPAGHHRNGMRMRSHMQFYLAARAKNCEHETFVISSEVEKSLTVSGESVEIFRRYN